MTTVNRWKQAQEYEQGYWEGVARRIAEGSYQQIAFYDWRAGELRRRLEAVGESALLAEGTARILELGSGPVGVVGYLEGAERVAVDPLNDYYRGNDRLTELRNPDVRYLSAPGEAVPLESDRYDLVIIENCIDHVQDVGAVMSEIRRLLKPGGYLYITVNSRSLPGYWIHQALARLGLDPGHPHTFTPRRFRRLLRDHGFTLRSCEAGSWWEAWVEDFRGEGWRARAKAALLVSEFLLIAVARKA